MRCRKTLFAAAAVVVAIGSAGHITTAEEVKPFPVPVEGTPLAPKQKENAYGEAKYWKSHWGDKKTVLMKGDVKFTHGETILTSDQVEYDESAQTAISPGKLRIVNPDCDITGSKGTAYFKKKTSLIEGNVVMLVKFKDAQPAKADKESVEKFKNPTTVTCPKLEYRYKDKVATATGGVVFKQEKRTMTADKAVYDLKKELLTLIGNVKGMDEEENQSFSSPGKVVMSLKKGDEWMEAENANASFKIEIEDEGGE